MRILIADDHPVVRAGLRALLSAHDDFEVVGEAANGAEAVDLAERLAPTIVLMDIRMGAGLDGIDATRRITRLPSPPKVLVVTTYDSDADVLRAVEAGASGYLLKETPPDEVFAALHTVATGETALSPSIASRLTKRLRAPDLALSHREIEILELLAAGRANKEIGKALFISEATVKTHLAHIYNKLGVDNRTAAVRAAVDSRLIRLT